MLSTCPACVAQVKHADDLKEVTCDVCGEKFNTYLSPEDSAGHHEEAATEFSESLAAFQEVREFGEKLGLGDEPPLETPPTKPYVPPPAPVEAEPVATNDVPFTDAATGDVLVSSGDSLQGYEIESYLPPISMVAEAKWEEPNPLGGPIAQLFAQATASGASALLGFRYQTLPDGRLVLFATPVKARKQS